MKPEINLEKLIVDTVTNSSGIFYGDNRLHSFKGTSEKNEGFGVITGDKNSIYNSENQVIKSRL